jgi:hypothetical protein
MMSLQDWRTCFPPASSAVRIGTLVRVVPELARATSKSPMFARRPLPLRASRARKPPFCLRADSQGSAFGEPGGKADLLDPTAQTFADLGDWDRHPTRMAAGVAGSKASPGRWRRARNCWETGSRNQPPEAATIHLTSALQVAGHNHLGFSHKVGDLEREAQSYLPGRLRSRQGLRVPHLSTFKSAARPVILL